MITIRTTPEPEWVARFLAALRAGNDSAQAARVAGVTTANAALRRRRHAEFARAWAECEVVKTRPTRRPPSPTAPRAPRGAAKLDRFIAELAETSNVSAAAAVADVSVGAIYKLRRTNAEFARRWYAALAEGYDNLEMELLGRLRSGEGGGAEATDKRQFDTAAALRCLAAHRESVAREKGRRALAEEVTTIAAINAKIDKLRLAGEAGAAAIAAARKAKARELETRGQARALPAPIADVGDAR